MSIHLHLASAKKEAQQSLVRHIQILNDVKLRCITNNTENDGFMYLMSIPIIYAAWEGYFKIACAICLKRHCRPGQKVKSYTEIYAALWLQKEGFLASFLQKLLNTMTLGSSIDKKGAGKFEVLTEFTKEMKNWLDGPVDHFVDFDSLVMTHSNVNKNVAELNSKIIGLDVSGINFGRLDGLLAQRNSIAHGGLITHPTKINVEELLTYTQGLITDFHDAVITWLNKK